MPVFRPPTGPYKGTPRYLKHLGIPFGYSMLTFRLYIPYLTQESFAGLVYLGPRDVDGRCYTPMRDAHCWMVGTTVDFQEFEYVLVDVLQQLIYCLCVVHVVKIAGYSWSEGINEPVTISNRFGYCLLVLVVLDDVVYAIRI